MQKGAAWDTGTKQRSQADLASHGAGSADVLLVSAWTVLYHFCTVHKHPCLGESRDLETMHTLRFSNYPGFPNYQGIQKSKWLSNNFWKTQHHPWRRLWILSSLTLWLEIWTALDNQRVCPECNLSFHDICKPVPKSPLPISHPLSSALYSCYDHCWLHQASLAQKAWWCVNFEKRIKAAIPCSLRVRALSHPGVKGMT